MMNYLSKSLPIKLLRYANFRFAEKFDVKKFDQKQSSRATGVFDKSKERYTNQHKDVHKIDIESNLDDIFESSNNIPTTQKDLLEKDISFERYIEESDKLFKKLVAAFEEVCKAEKKVTINPAVDKFTLRISVGKVGDYIIHKELETMLVTLTSPVSGLFKYRYEPLNGHWVSIKDKHILNEILMREFCHHSGGLLMVE
jgi:frataxin-like iron-binding protein CyaY